jgi:hypothetical protein
VRPPSVTRSRRVVARTCKGGARGEVGGVGRVPQPVVSQLAKRFSPGFKATLLDDVAAAMQLHAGSGGSGRACAVAVGTGPTSIAILPVPRVVPPNHRLYSCTFIVAYRAAEPQYLHIQWLATSGSPGLTQYSTLMYNQSSTHEHVPS